MAAHSKHGMSAQSIIIACAGSISMSDGIEEDGDNTAAEKGTAVHDAGEFAFKTGVSGDDLYGMKFNGIKITKPMVESINIYVNQLREYDSNVTTTSYVEQRVCLSSIDRDLLWGTADYIGINYFDRKLIVADYKNGFISVDVDKDQYVHALNKTMLGNAQLAGYAIGALDTFNLWDKVDTIETCIIQPNKPHEDGPIRKFMFTMPEIKDWWATYKISHSLATQVNPPRNAGKHCKYCKARGVCSTRINDTISRIKLDTAINKVEPEQLIELFEHADVMINSIKQLKEEVVKLSRKGYKVPNHKLVKAWKRAVLQDEQAMLDEAIQLGKTVEDIYKMEPKSKTDIKAIMGDKFAHKHYKTPEAGLKLVPMTDPGAPQRPDKMSSAAGVFTPVG